MTHHNEEEYTAQECYVNVDLLLKEGPEARLVSLSNSQV